MKKSRKLLSLLLAGVSAVTSIFAGSVNAAAADKLKLVTAPYDYIGMSMGRDMWYYINTDTNSVDISCITEKQLKNFRKTGNLEFTKVDFDGSELAEKYPDIQYMYDRTSLRNSNYAFFVCKNEETGEDVNYLYKYNQKKNKLVQVEAINEDSGFSPKGNYYMYRSPDDETKYYCRYNSSYSGKKTVDFGEDDNGAYIKCGGLAIDFFKSSNYIFFCSEGTGKVVSTLPGQEMEGQVLSMDQDGKLKLVTNKKLFVKYSGKNFISFGKKKTDDTDYSSYAVNSVYLTEKDKLYTLKNSTSFRDKTSGLKYTLFGFTASFKGTRSWGVYYTLSGAEIKYKYCIVDVAKDKLIGSKVDWFEANDNNKELKDLTLVYDYEKGYGIANKNGKVSEWFDNARFGENSKYIAVVKDGKFWLADKNLKAVSEKIDAPENCELYVYENDLFVFGTEQPYKYTWVTYK